MKPLRLSALAAGLFLAACAAPSPTDPAAGSASFDEGPGTAGGGNFTTQTQDGGNTIGSGNWTGASTAEDSTPTDPTRSGVGTMGSGG